MRRRYGILEGERRRLRTSVGQRSTGVRWIGKRTRFESKRTFGERVHNDENNHAAANDHDTGSGDYASTYDHDSNYDDDDDDNDDNQKVGNDESAKHRPI